MTDRLMKPSQSLDIRQCIWKFLADEFFTVLSLMNNVINMREILVGN